LSQATAAARELCRARFEAFGSAGQAGKIKPLSLDKMAESYRKPLRKSA
jgi:fructose-bisphosphate aldolase class II